MKKYIYMFIFLSALAGSLPAADDYLRQFNDAAKLYENGEYPKAIETYKNIISGGQKNAALLYNLGNAYYKNAETGNAMLSYERAERLSPADPDIRSNIQFIRRSIQESEPSLLDSVTGYFIGIASIDNIALAALFFFCVFILGISIFLFYRSRLLLVANAFSAVLLIFFSTVFILQFHDQVLTNWAVVVTATDARNGPGDDNSVSFSVPEGRKVMILSEQGQWYAIGLKNEGLKGWVEKKDIEAI